MEIMTKAEKVLVAACVLAWLLLVGGITARALVFVLDTDAQVLPQPQNPDPSTIIQPPPLLCAFEGGWLIASCNPVHDYSCPIDICVTTVAKNTIIETTEFDLLHENGQSFREHYCAAFETAKILWQLYFNQTFPYSKSSRCN